MLKVKKDPEKAGGIAPGTLVISLAGRDKGRCYVAAELHDGRVYVADGKKHKLIKPKPKNPKHISPVGRIDSESLTDKRLRRLIYEFKTQNELSAQVNTVP